MRRGIAAVSLVLWTGCGHVEDFFAPEEPEDAMAREELEAEPMPAASPATEAPDAPAVDEAAASEVVFLAIDEATYAVADSLVSELDGEPIGPASGDNVERFRELHARLVEALDDAQPRLVVFDVAFGATMSGPASDQLGAALALADIPVVLAAPLDPVWTGHASIYEDRVTGHAEFVRHVESDDYGMPRKTDAGLPLYGLEGEDLSRPPLASAAYRSMVGDVAGTAVTACVTETYATSLTLLGNADDLRLVVPARRGGDDVRRVSAATLLASEDAQRGEADGGAAKPPARPDLRDAVLVVGFDVPGVDRIELEAQGEYIARGFGHAWALRNLLEAGPDCLASTEP